MRCCASPRSRLTGRPRIRGWADYLWRDEEDRRRGRIARPAVWCQLSRRLDRFQRVASWVAPTHHGCGSVSPIPNPAKHFLAHHEAEQLSGLDDEPSPRLRVRVTLTHEQPR